MPIDQPEQPPRRLWLWGTPRRRMHLSAWILAVGAAIAVVASWSSTNTPMERYGYVGLFIAVVGLVGAGVSWIQVWMRWLVSRRAARDDARSTG